MGLTLGQNTSKVGGGSPPPTSKVFGFDVIELSSKVKGNTNGWLMLFVSFFHPPHPRQQMRAIVHITQQLVIVKWGTRQTSVLVSIHIGCLEADHREVRKIIASENLVSVLCLKHCHNSHLVRIGI